MAYKGQFSCEVCAAPQADTAGWFFIQPSRTTLTIDRWDHSLVTHEDHTLCSVGCLSIYLERWAQTQTEFREAELVGC